MNFSESVCKVQHISCAQNFYIRIYWINARKRQIESGFGEPHVCRGLENTHILLLIYNHYHLKWHQAGPSLVIQHQIERSNVSSFSPWGWSLSINAERCLSICALAHAIDPSNTLRDEFCFFTVFFKLSQKFVHLHHCNVLWKKSYTLTQIYLSVGMTPSGKLRNQLIFEFLVNSFIWYDLRI